MPSLGLTSSELAETTRQVLALDDAVMRLVSLAERIGIPSPQHTGWYTLLKQKLLPQLTERSLMVVAVVGGTNTGKSLLFNQLAGENASSVDARAAGTKHPVCLLPEEPFIKDAASSLTPETLLHRYFEMFSLVAWHDPNQPLTSSDDHRLYWRLGKNVPARLMLLDTPDIDSDVAVNWERATAIRQAADILLAVVTPQKYNDAAVRRFFREATEAGKQTILLWNMVDIEQDAGELPRWTQQFSDETGTQPLAVYVAPHDREAAASLHLPIRPAERLADFETSVNLAGMLGDVHFEAVKKEALLGAIGKILDRATGFPAYLDKVRATASQFEAARNMLQHLDKTAVDWPNLPTPILVEEIRQWWNAGRPGWSQTVHGSYRWVGGKIVAPLRWTWSKISKSPQVESLDDFQQKERDAVSLIIEKSIRQLERLAETDNPVLRHELHEMIGGENRQRLFERARQIPLSPHPVDAEFRDHLRHSLDEWSQQNPKFLKVLRSADHVAAVARPLVTVTLLAGGFFGASQLIGQAGVQAVEVVITGGVTAGGEALAHTAGEGMTQSAARFFQQVRLEFVRHRASLFYDWLHRELWTSVADRLNQGAEITQSDEFCTAEEALERLRTLPEN